MAGRILDRFSGAVLAPFGKMPCDTATSAPINLTGYQTVSAVNLNTDNMRCLVMNQTDTTKNGIYMVKSADWIRAADFDGPTGTVNGQLILVTGGNQAGVWELVTPNPVQIDHSGGQTTSPSNIIFSRWSGSGVGGYEIDVTSFGAKPDARMVIDLVATLGSPIVSSASANFTRADVGKVFKAYSYAFQTGVILGTILSVQSATQATISANAIHAAVSGEALGYWGTDNSAALNAAYLHASTLISQVIAPIGTLAASNAPFGDGHIRVVHPIVPGIGAGYLSAQTLTCYRNLLLDAEAMMYNAISLGDNDRNWFITCGGGLQIDRFILECGGGMGIINGGQQVPSSSFIRGLQLWNVGVNFNAGLPQLWQTGFQAIGFDYNITDYWIKGGNAGIIFQNVGDVRMTLIELIGCSTGLIVTGSENVQFNKMVFDTCSTYGIAIDGCHTVFGDGNAFSVNATGLTYIAEIGLFDNVNINANIRLDMNCQRSGGAGYYISYAQDASLKIVASNSSNYSGGGVALTYCATYGGSNQGIIEVDALRDNFSSPGVANFTGSRYGIFWDKYMNVSTPTVHLYGTLVNP